MTAAAMPEAPAPMIAIFMFRSYPVSVPFYRIIIEKVHVCKSRCKKLIVIDRKQKEGLGEVRASLIGTQGSFPESNCTDPFFALEQN